jgi:hypothetical protein
MLTNAIKASRQKRGLSQIDVAGPGLLRNRVA